MAQLNYEIPDELHKALKVKAAQEGVTLKDLITFYLAYAEDQSPSVEAIRTNV